MIATKPKRVLIDSSTLDFLIMECEQMHALCDRSDVPRELDGNVLSMAQRVGILEGVFQGILCKYLKRDPLPLH